MTTKIEATGMAGRVDAADKEAGPTLEEYYSAIATLAQAFYAKYNRMPDAVCLPYGVDDSIYTAIMAEVTVRAKNQPPGRVWVGVDGDISNKAAGVSVTIKAAMPDSEQGEKPSVGKWLVVAPRPDGTTSHVSRIMWHTDTLYVEFNDGSMYSYADVPAATFRKMVKAPSIGDYLHSNIKGTFAHKKLGADEAKMITGGIPSDKEGGDNFLARYVAARKKDTTPKQALKPRPGVYVKLIGDDLPHAIEVALQDGYQQMVGQGYNPNNVALPLNTPQAIADFLTQNGVGVATWPAPDGQVWVGILD